MAQRVTDVMVMHAKSRVIRLLREAGVTEPVTLYGGNASMHVTNKLLVGKTNVWPDGMAGHTKTEAYNALRLMTAALALAVEARED